MSEQNLPVNPAPVGPQTAPDSAGFAISDTPATILTDRRCLPMCHELYERAKKRGIQPDELKRWIAERYKVTSMKHLTLAQYKELKKIVSALPIVQEAKSGGVIE